MKTFTLDSTRTNGRKATFRKWKNWRARLRFEFLNLLVQQRHFHELEAITKPYIGSGRAWELARSMAQNYGAFAITSIRRLSEFPKAKTAKSREIVSLPTFLMDVQANAYLITRRHQRRRYKKAMRHFPEYIYVAAADRVHDAVANGKDILEPQCVESDLKLIRQTVRRISKLADKVYAHVERDRRRIPREFPFNEADPAIKILLAILRKYSLCLFGEEIVLPEIDDYSIAEDLRKIWPSNAPLPQFPSPLDDGEPWCP